MSNKQIFDMSHIMKEQQNVLECFSGKKRGLVMTLFHFYKGHLRDLFFAAFFFIVKNSPTLILPIVTAGVINIAVYRPENATEQFILYGLLAAVCLVVNIFTTALQVRFLSKVQRSVEAGLRGAMVRKLQQLSISFHKNTESGKIQSKVMRDVEAIEAFTSQIFTTGLGFVFESVVALVIVLNSNFDVFLMFLACVPIAILITNIFRKKMTTLNSNFRKKMEATSSAVLETEELIPVTRAHALEMGEIQKMTESVTDVAKSGYQLDKVNGTFAALNWVTFRTVHFFCLFFTASLALKGEIPVGNISLYQNYFGTLVAQISAVISILPIITKGAEAINSIGEILSSHEIEDNRNKQKLTKLVGKYEFKNVHFTYEDDDVPILNGLDLTVNAGETVAFVGESGSGKSTILNLVIGFNKASEGNVLIDDIDANDLDMRSYRRFISVVPQNSILFSGTIRQNITYGSPKITDEMLDYAIKAARLEDVIAGLQNGIETQVGEHGAKLSGGQRQRISIARAIIRNPKVIIFDEATSALDSVTEKQIQEAIDNLTKNRTTFIVAHRLSTIKNADKIAVIVKGRCVEYGTYDELMAKKGEFYKLKQMQA